MYLYLASLAAMLSPAHGLTEAPAINAAAAQPAAVALESFAKPPFIEQPALSPDGLSLAGLFSVAGTQIIGIKSLSVADDFVPVGVPEGTEANWIRWVNNENVLVGVSALLPVDPERWYITRLISINVRTKKVTRLLWDLGGQNASDLLWLPSDGSTEILVAAQNSIYLGAEFWPAVYRVNVETGRYRRILAGREDVNDWSVDSSGNVRTGIAYHDESRTFRLLYRESNGDSFRTIDAANSRKGEALLRPFFFLPEAGRALVVHDDEQGRSAIYETDLLTQKDIRAVFVMPEGRGEVSYPVLSGDGTALLGAATTQADGKIHWIDPDLANLQAQFDKAVPGNIARIVSFNQDRSKMLVTVGQADTPGIVYYYDVDRGRLQRFAAMNEVIGARRLAPVKLVHYRSRDGLEIEGILTLPAGPARRNRPFVIMPHGGPWARDTLSYDYTAQFLASKGYAVLQPNYRGSTGYGTEFLKRGVGQLGLAMQDDLTDGVRWAVKEGIADEKRVCIVGASYGGYAAMWGTVADPDLYRCAISIAGVSSLRREVNDFGSKLMGSKFKDDWTRMTPDFDLVSPFNAADRIKTPLLLIHGKRDVTVDVSQSSRMYGRMQKAGKTVEYVQMPLADHYFTREQDRITLLSAMGAFLDKHNPAETVEAK